VRASFEHERRENKIKDISRDQNVWKFARLFFVHMHHLFKD
jgi:hypothetical protein